MAKPVVMWKSLDGRKFDTEAKADEWDNLLSRVRKAESLIRWTPDDPGCRFANGRGYIQHGRADVLAFKRALLNIAADELKDSRFRQWADDAENVHPMSIVGRILNDAGSVVYRPWMRLASMDDQCREWGQPFYAAHPDQGEPIAL